MPDDVKNVNLYGQDFFAWGLAQARVLRSARDAIQHPELRNTKLQRALQALDWDNLAEEIEGLARRDRRELASQIVTIIEHLAKLENSSALEPRRGRIDTIEREREEVLEIMRDSPSLRREVPGLIARRTRVAVRRALGNLVDRGEMAQAAAARIKLDYTEEQLLGDWLPEPAASPRQRNGRRRRADA